MTSIVISSDDPELCRTIGEMTAETLGYTHMDQAFLERVATHFEVPVDKLQGVLDAKTARRIGTRSRDLLLAYVAAMTLEEFQKDGIVCTGLAAHLYVRDVSHVLMVRVLGDPRTLAARIVATNHVSLRKAEKILQRNRARSARWSIDSFGLDEVDPSVYDMVLSVGQIEMEKMVHVIKDLANYRKFRAMTYSRNHLNELALAAKVRLALLADYPDVKVRVAGTRAIVHVTCSKRAKRSTTARIKEAAGRADGITSVEVHAKNAKPVISKIRRLLPFG